MFEDNKDTKVSKFTKLAVGGDYRTWCARMECHFSSLGLWAHVENGTAIADSLVDAVTPEMKAARCKRDLLISLHDDLAKLVAFEKTANDIWVRIKKMFVGTVNAEKRMYRRQLQQWEFRGNYFKFISGFEDTVAKMKKINAVDSWTDTGLLFLEKMPRDHAPVTHTLRKALEAADDNESQYRSMMDSVIEYLMDAGLYNMKSQRPNTSSFHSGGNSRGGFALQSHVKHCHRCKKKHKGRCLKCYGCHEWGHKVTECPKKKSNGRSRQKSSGKHRDDDTNSVVSAKSMFTRAVYTKTAADKVQEWKDFFLLDSGATFHTCGCFDLFSNVQELKTPEMIETANGHVFSTVSGDVKLKLFNGLHVVLRNVLTGRMHRG